jgi:hypothetical protein
MVLAGIDCTQVLFVRVRNDVAHLTPIISVTGSRFVVKVDVFLQRAGSANSNIFHFCVF